MKARKNVVNAGHNSHVCSSVTPLGPPTPLRRLPIISYGSELSPYWCLSPARMLTTTAWDVLFHLCIPSTCCHTCASLVFSTSSLKDHACLCASVKAIPGSWNQGGLGRWDGRWNKKWSWGQTTKNSNPIIKEFRLYRACGLFSPWGTGGGQPDKNPLWWTEALKIGNMRDSVRDRGLGSNLKSALTRCQALC